MEKFFKARQIELYDKGLNGIQKLFGKIVHDVLGGDTIVIFLENMVFIFCEPGKTTLLVEAVEEHINIEVRAKSDNFIVFEFSGYRR